MSGSSHFSFDLTDGNGAAGTDPLFGDADTNFGFTASLSDDFMADDEALPDLTPEYPANDVGDLQAAAPLRQPSEEEIVTGIEDALLDLLSQGRRTDILVLTGELPDMLNTIDEDVTDEFGSAYIQAILLNPALKWYGKFAKVLSADQFYMDEQGLVLKLGAAQFKKLVGSFLADFKEEYAEESPIVSVVRDLAKQAGALDTAKTASRLAADRKGRQADAGQFDPTASSFTTASYEPLQPSVKKAVRGRTAAQRTAEDDVFNTTLDDTPDANDEGDTIAMTDWPHKAVASHCDGLKLASEKVPSYLLNQGFSKQAANEVAGIVKFMRLDRSLQKSGAGNRGSGAVDFNFGF